MLFRSVVWEYVSNGLQYCGPGTNPVVKAALDSKKKRISVQDNGRGMDWAGLQNFFVMHGENIDRKEGRPGRGRFGTGKSAAFGIAELLRITTIRNGKRSKVQLQRKNVEEITSEAPIPVEVLEQEIPTSSANGTLIEIEGVHLRSLDQSGIIHYIERHLAKWPKNAPFKKPFELPPLDDLPPLREGDLLAVFTAGAYGMSMASRYNAQPLPAEVLVEGERATLVRRRETVTDLLAHEMQPVPLA